MASAFIESDSSWIAIAAVTVVVALQAARDSLWQHDLSMRALSLVMWLAAPVGAYSSRQFIENDVAGMKAVLLVGMVWVLIATWGRPALLMRDAWPDAAKADSALNRHSLKCTAVFIVGTVAATLVWVAMVLAGVL